MLPILPVLLLLFFQGPANIERMAHEGRLPAAIEAIQRLDGEASAEREAFASLLAASKDADFTQALFTILRWVDAPATTPQAAILPEGAERLPIHSVASLAISDGFQASRRSRDGPFPVV